MSSLPMYTFPSFKRLRTVLSRTDLWHSFSLAVYLGVPISTALAGHYLLSGFLIVPAVLGAYSIAVQRRNRRNS